MRRELTLLAIGHLLIAPWIDTGCLDSLVYYKRLLVTLLGPDEDTRQEPEAINKECLSMLERLQTIDTTRQMRYKDLGELARS